MQLEEKSDEGIVKLRSWAEFKSLVESLKPKAIVYNIEQHGLSAKRELTNLRLMPSGSAYYVLLDFPRGERLRETGLPIKKDDKGNRYLDEEDVIRFLKEQFKRDDLIICSYWTI